MVQIKSTSSTTDTEEHKAKIVYKVQDVYNYYEGLHARIQYTLCTIEDDIYFCVCVCVCVCVCMCVCVCNRPPVSEVCPNYEVVMFQPLTVTPPHLVSIAIVTYFISSPPAPPDYIVFLYCSFPYSILLPPHQQPFIVGSLYLFSPAPHPLSWSEAPPTWTSPTPATRQPLSLVSAPHA